MLTKKIAYAALLTVLGSIAPSAAETHASWLAGASSSVSNASEAELCFGQVPTMVGAEEEQPLVGTDGADVVIAHGGEVSTGDGDDLVCVIGVPKHGQPPGKLIYAGSGNDRVDNSRSGYEYVTYLGEGADEYIGGPADEYVNAFEDSQNGGVRDRAVDIITTAGSRDWVFSGGGSDIVDLGAGRDRLFLSGPPAADGVFIGGSHSDSLDLRLLDPKPHSWTIDNRAERLFRDEQPMGGWDSFRRFGASARGGPITFLGSDQDEGLRAFRPQWPLAVRMGGGDDKVHLVRGAPVDHQLHGGTGTDTLAYGVGLRQGFDNLPRDIYLDLSAGVLRDTRQSGGEPTSFGAFNFENANVANPTRGALCTPGECVPTWGRTVMMGTSGPNVLSTNVGAATMYGMAGDDVLIGSQGGDVLIGNAGNDEAIGRRGTDHCEAESRLECER